MNVVMVSTDGDFFLCCSYCFFWSSFFFVLFFSSCVERLNIFVSTIPTMVSIGNAFARVLCVSEISFNRLDFAVVCNSHACRDVFVSIHEIHYMPYKVDMKRHQIKTRRGQNHKKSGRKVEEGRDRLKRMGKTRKTTRADGMYSRR